MRATECPVCAEMPDSFHAGFHRLGDAGDDLVAELAGPVRWLARRRRLFSAVWIACLVILAMILLGALLGIIPTYPAHTPCCSWWPLAGLRGGR